MSSYPLARGGTIEFIWEPNPEVIAQKYLSLAEYLENFGPPLEASKAVARADMQQHFDSESGPSGDAWAPLSEETIARWGEHPILDLTGDLKASATSEHAYFVDGHDLFFDTGALPGYWVYPNFGTSVAHMRAFVEQVGEENLVPGAKHSGGGQPPRPFVGFSEEAEIKIVAVFDAWFEGGISGFVAHGTGTVQPITSRGFGPGITG